MNITTGKMSTNNADFELHRLFHVKDKVALVTGGGEHGLASYFIHVLWLVDL